jgi:hypothetical protein
VATLAAQSMKEWGGFYAINYLLHSTRSGRPHSGASERLIWGA